MFVVTGLHSKRRPYTGSLKSSKTTRRQIIEKPSFPLVVSHSNRHPRHVNISASPLATAPPRVSGPSMTRNESNIGTWNRSDKAGHTIKIAFGRVAPPRVRRFIPKPLILVERMKARQLLLESLPADASESRVVPGSLTCPKNTTTTPLSAHMTPPTRWRSTCRTRSSDSHSSSSVSFLLSLRNDTVPRSGFGMMPRVRRPLSVVTLGDSSASTDTFVADSPCYVKRASSKLPLLVATTDTTQAHLDVESCPGEQVSHTGHLVSVDSVAADFVHPTCQLTDSFEPPETSTPFASGQAATHGVISPMAFIASAECPTRIPEQTPANEPSGGLEIMSPTSRAVYHFNSPTGAHIVRLPNSGTCLKSWSSTDMSHPPLTKSGSPGVTLASVPKPALDLKRPSGRGTSPSPTLVLDGVFALSQLPSPALSASSEPLPQKTLDGGFARPRKPTSRRRPFSDTSNTPTDASPSQRRSASPMSPHGRSGTALESSPRSKLAGVLTAHALARPPTLTQAQTGILVSGVRKQAHAAVPPLVKGVPASNDPRTQCEIEGLRARRVVGLSRDTGRDDCGDGSGASTARGAIERMSLASVGVVAKLRAQWEAGNAGGVR